MSALCCGKRVHYRYGGPLLNGAVFQFSGVIEEIRQVEVAKDVFIEKYAVRGTDGEYVLANKHELKEIRKRSISHESA